MGERPFEVVDGRRLLDGGIDGLGRLVLRPVCNAPLVSAHHTPSITSGASSPG